MIYQEINIFLDSKSIDNWIRLIWINWYWYQLRDDVYRIGNRLKPK